MRSWLEFQFKGNPWLFLVWNCKLQNRPKNEGLNRHLSTWALALKGYYIDTKVHKFLKQCLHYLHFKNLFTEPFQVRDYPWVETHVNSALGHINITKVELNSDSWLFLFWSKNKFDGFPLVGTNSTQHLADKCHHSNGWYDSYFCW